MKYYYKTNCAVTLSQKAVFAFATAVFALFLLVAASPARAAKFNLVVKKPAVKVGGETIAYIELIPGAGEKVMGGWLTFTVNPEFILLPGDKNRYASDAVFSKVEKFAVDPVGGTLTYKVQTDKPVNKTKIFLEIPMKFLQEGISPVSFTSYVYMEDKEREDGLARQPANTGYQRVAGVTGPVDPVLFSTLVGENTTLKETSLASGLEKATGTAVSQQNIELDLGVTSLQKTESDAEADVVVEFSKRQKTIGIRQWIRLDVMVSKFPEYETLSGVQMKIKYDPTALVFTNAVGQETGTVETNDVFNIIFVNQVDRLKGEINVAIGAGFAIDNPDLLKAPAKIFTLYFKGIKETGQTVVSFDDVKVPVTKSDAKLASHDSNIGISASQSDCDSDLPATLCSGSFKVTGNVSFTLSNKNEYTRNAVTVLENSQPTTSQNVKINRYSLEQMWNMRMDGSFRNGIRLTGSLLDNPSMQQKVNLELLAGDWSTHFGDFNTSIQESNLVQLNSSEVTGLQVRYNYNKFRLRAISAELKSSPGETFITGNGQTGPYAFANTASPIIPSSVRVYDNNNRPMNANEYMIDYGRYQIYFTEPLLSDKRVSIKYQQSSLLFSTGNIQAFRLDYNPDNTNFKMGATYFTTMSPKSNTLVKLSAADSIDSTKLILYTAPDGSATTTFPCPAGQFGEGRTCSEIKLTNEYIIEGSIKLYNKSTGDQTSYTESSPYIFIPHRGYLEGRIIVDRSRFSVVNMDISYSYYNPSLISQPAVTVFNIQGKQMTDRGLWPTIIFPGSEILYLSNDPNQYDIIEGSDEIVCFKDNIESDDNEFCPGSYVPRSNRTYYLEGQDNYAYAQLDGVITDKMYLKVKYTPIPADISGGSEFQKTAWSVDSSFKIGNKISVKTEYAMANSDLSASFNTVSEELVVDVPTKVNNTFMSGIKCDFWPSSDSTNPLKENYLICRLNRNNLSGAIKMQVQKCDLKAGANDECEEITPGEFTYRTDPRIYDVIIPNSDINKKDGTFRITLKNWRSDAIATYPSFPVLKGDKLIITYTYDQSIDRIATGDAYYINTKYENKNISLAIDRRARDPLFDNAVSKFNDNTISKTTYDLSLKLAKKFNIVANKNDSLEQSVDDTGAVRSSYSKPSNSVTLGWDISKSAKFNINKSSNTTKGELINQNSPPTIQDTTNGRTSATLSFSLRKLKYNFALARSEDETKNRAGTQPDTKTNINKFAFDYKPSKKYNLKYTLDTTKSPTTSSKTESRAYVLTMTPIQPLSITVNMSRNNIKSGALTPPTTTDNMRYGFTYNQYRKFKAINVSFDRTSTPGNTIENPYSSRNDSSNMSFSISPTKSLTINPRYSRTANSQETKSANRSNSKSWNAIYNKRIKKKDTLNTTYTETSTQNNTTSFTSTGQIETRAASKKKTLDVVFKKPSGTTITGRFDRSLGNAANTTRSLQYSRKLTREILFNTSLNLSRTFGTSPSKTNTYRLAFDWSLDQNTKFNLSYSRDITRYSLSAIPTNARTSFQTSLTTNFR